MGDSKVIRNLKCSKIEEKETETEKGTSTVFTYTFADDDKDYTVTVKAKGEMPYTVGQDIDVTLGMNQTTFEAFKEGDGQTDVLQETEAEPKAEPDPAVFPVPKTPEPALENPGCTFYLKQTEEDGSVKPGLCSSGAKKGPFCAGPDCEMLKPEAEREKELEIPIDFEDNTVAFDTLKFIKEELAEEALLATFIKQYNNFGSDELETVLSFLEEHEYIEYPEGDVTCEKPVLTEKGENRLAPAKVGKEEKGSPKTPSKEKKKASPKKKPAKKEKKEKPSTGSRDTVGENPISKKPPTPKKEVPLQNTLEALTNGDGPKEKEGAPTEPAKGPRGESTKQAKEFTEELKKKEQPEIEEIVEPEPEARTSCPSCDMEFQGDEGPIGDDCPYCGTAFIEDELANPTIEKDVKPNWGMTGSVLLKKISFPTSVCGGLSKDVVVEKNEKQKELYAHAIAIRSPETEDETQRFIRELNERTPYQWTHVLDKTFNADTNQLNGKASP